MTTPDGMHADAHEASVQPDPAPPACAKDRALVALAELVIETRDAVKSAIATRDVYSLEPLAEKLDRYGGVCREVLHPSGRRAGGLALAEKRGREHLAEAGRKGGAALVASRGPEWMAELGRRGAASRAAKRAQSTSTTHEGGVA